MGVSEIEVGKKDQLRESAAYPRAFGLAFAGLMSCLPVPVEPQCKGFAYPLEGDDLGALDDLRLGAQKAWWKQL